MFIELIDLLRCPVEHEESWLVAAFTKMDRRFVIEGKLGCPVCSASYPIVEGIAEFAPGRPLTQAGDIEVSPDEVIRIAALLGLTRPGMSVVLDRPQPGLAGALVEKTGARVVVVNPLSLVPETENAAAVRAGARLPLPSRSVDGIVLGSDADNDQLSEAARVLKQGGRLVTPASIGDPLPGFRALARDERHIVLESVGELVRLSR